MSESRWKRRFVSWVRIGNWLLIPIYIFVIALPLYYEWKTEIPSVEQFNRADGNLVYKRIVKKGALIGLKSDEGAQYFTCRPGLFTNTHDCLISTQMLDGLIERPATVWWFEQTIYPLSTQRRLVKLVVDGQEKVSIAMTEKRTDRASEDAPWFAVGLSVFFVLIAIYFERLARRIEHGQSNG